MDLDAVTFPALIVAEDGWVDYLASVAQLEKWTNTAIKKYNKRRVLLYDCSDHAWLVESIVSRARRKLFVRLIHAVYNPKTPVQISVRPITECPTETVRDALLLIIDKDDDVLTQHTEASDLKTEIQHAASFKAVVQALRAARAI
jgi:hypothetical protein